MSPLGFRVDYGREIRLFSGILLTTCGTVCTGLCLAQLIATKTFSPVTLLGILISNLNFSVLMSVVLSGLLAVRFRLQTINECFQ